MYWSCGGAARGLVVYKRAAYKLAVAKFHLVCKRSDYAPRQSKGAVGGCLILSLYVTADDSGLQG
jgi:hypothetical protein